MGEGRKSIVVYEVKRRRYLLEERRERIEWTGKKMKKIRKTRKKDSLPGSLPPCPTSLTSPSSPSYPSSFALPSSPLSQKPLIPTMKRILILKKLLCCK